MIIYGIKNCDTVKKAKNWLQNNNFSYDFHDYKSKGITAEVLTNWISQVGFEGLINKKGTTWKQLDESVKNSITNDQAAIELMKEKTSVIKRPIIEKNGKIVVLGFNDEEYQKKIK